MKIAKIMQAYSFIIVACILSCYISIQYVSSQCIDDQKSLLLELRNTLEFNISYSTKLASWNASTDCCLWGGVTCDPSNGQVIGLNLLFEGITGGISSSSSLFRMHSLQILGLAYNYINGVIPSSITALHQLEYLYLSSNNFSGPIPSFSSTKNLRELSLSGNKVSGSIASTNWEELVYLKTLDLSNNLLTGNIPTSLFSMQSLWHLDLSKNKFSGQLNEFESKPSPMLTWLDLSSNYLEGPIPNSIFQLRGLAILYLSGNRFHGALELNEILHPLKNLTALNLSYNNLSIDTSGSPTTNSSFPQFNVLGLASCDLGTLPEFLKTQARLEFLDLSNNHIQGIVPRWIWNMSIINLNLSRNNFVELERPIPFSLSMKIVDLHSNNIQGEVPSLKTASLMILDCSSNNFTSINPAIGNNISDIFIFLSLARNNIYGRIPASLCNATQLEVLNLEGNHFKGTIPDCLVARTQNLAVLNAKGNNLTGVIPDKFEKKCMLETLNLNSNFFQGPIPRSLAYCEELKVLDLGNNQFSDGFPCELKSLPKLQVLVLRSNKFSGSIACLKENSMWPLLQILDLAMNEFGGELKAGYILKWNLMMAGTRELLSEQDRLLYNTSFGYRTYQDTVEVTMKGNDYVLQKILKIFSSIDLSNNAFHGEIPRDLGNLNSLIVLNVSHNSLTGIIPSSFGNLTQLESLDLSCNALSGNIPQEFAKLTFLGFLNLSHNKLEGQIPTSTQLQSFDSSSYEGNQGLYGPPLTPSSRSGQGSGVAPPMPSDGSRWSSKSEVEWMLRGAEVGLPVGLTIFIGPILYIKRWRQWYCYHLGRLVKKIMRRDYQATRGGRRIRRQRQQRH